MLVSFFKPNYPVTLLIALPLMLIALRLPGILAFPVNPDFENQNFLFEFFLRLCNFVPYAGAVLSLVFVYLQCLLINRIVNHFEFLKPATNLPALIYGLIMSFSVELHMLHPILLSNFFVLFALGRICSAFNQKAIFSEVFDSALLISIGSFFYFPIIVFYLFLFFNLIFTRPFVWREYVISLLGILVPYLFMFTWYYLNEQLTEVINNEILPFLRPVSVNIPLVAGFNIWLIGFIIMLLIFSCFVIIKYMVKNIVRIQYLWRTMFVLIVISFAVIALAEEKTMHILLVASVPTSFFLSGYFLLTGAKRFAELLFTALLLLIVYNVYF
jgi:hypothetical protein